MTSFGKSRMEIAAARLRTALPNFQTFWTDIEPSVISTTTRSWVLFQSSLLMLHSSEYQNCACSSKAETIDLSRDTITFISIFFGKWAHNSTRLQRSGQLRNSVFSYRKLLVCSSVQCKLLVCISQNVLTLRLRKINCLSEKIMRHWPGE